MNVTLYVRTFNFHKVVQQQNLRAVEDFILSYSAVYLRIQKWKNCWNRSTFAKVIVKIKVAPFLMAHGVVWSGKKFCFADQYPINLTSTRPLPDHYSTIHERTWSGTSHVKLDRSSFVGEFGWSGWSSWSDRQWESSVNTITNLFSCSETM